MNCHILQREDDFDLYSAGNCFINDFIESYGIINKAKYIGLVLGKDKQKEYIKRSFNSIEGDVSSFITGIETKTQVHVILEFMAELKQLEIDKEMKAFLEPKINWIRDNVLFEANKFAKRNFKYKNVYKEKEEDIYTSLICAIGEKDKQRVLQILGNIQDVNVVDKKTGSLALTEAIRVGDFELVKLLVNEYTADVNKKDGIGFTKKAMVLGRR